MDSPRLAIVETEAPAVIAMRESSVVSLAAHGGLDADQVAAAMAFGRAFHALDSVYARASAERIDVHSIADYHAETATAARAFLDQTRGLLGVHAYRLICRVCGQGFHIRDLYRTRRERDTATDILRMSLELLARPPG